MLYLDNGSTYIGEILRTACARLGISLLHARPYDAPARGKMERFWRTLREGCLDHLGSLTSLHDVEVRLSPSSTSTTTAPRTPRSWAARPGAVFAAAKRPADDLDEEKLQDALTVRERRRVRADTTVSVDGQDWELDQGFLAGRVVTVGRSLLDGAPWVEHEGQRLPLHPVDPEGERPPQAAAAPARRARGEARVTPFDPAGALLDRATGRRRGEEGDR